jgi:hypothetical protein
MKKQCLVCGKMRLHYNSRPEKCIACIQYALSEKLRRLQALKRQELRVTPKNRGGRCV